MHSRNRYSLAQKMGLLVAVILQMLTGLWLTARPLYAQAMQSTPNTGQHLLRKKFTLNDSWAYRITESMNLSAEALGIPLPFLPSQMSITYQVFEKVTNVYPDGRAVIRCTVEGVEGLFVSLINCTFDKEVNARGEILRLKMISGSEPLLLPTDIVLPEHAVAVGSSWRVKQSVPGFPSLDRELTYTLQSVSWQGNGWVAKIGFKEQHSAGQERLQILDLPVTVSGDSLLLGSLSVDTSTGRVISADLSAQVNIRGEAGKDMKGGMQIGFRSTVRPAYQSIMTDRSDQQTPPQSVVRRELNRLIEAGLLKTLMGYPYQVPEHWMIDTGHVVDGKYLPGTPLDPAIDAALDRRAPDLGLTNSLHHAQVWTLVLLEAAVLACELESAEDDFIQKLLEQAQSAEQYIAIGDGVISLLPVKDSLGQTKIRMSFTKQFNQQARDLLVSTGAFKGKQTTFRALHRFAFKRLAHGFEVLSTLLTVGEALQVILLPSDLEMLIRQAAVEQVLQEWCTFLRSHPEIQRDQALEKIIYQITSDDNSQVIEWLKLAIAAQEDKTLLDYLGQGATLWKAAADLAKTEPGKQIVIKARGAVQAGKEAVKFTLKGWPKMLNIPATWMKGASQIVSLWAKVTKPLLRFMSWAIILYDAYETAEQVWEYPIGVEAATLAYSLADWLTKQPASDPIAEEMGIYMLMVGDAHMQSYFDLTPFYAAVNIYAGTYLPGGKERQDAWKVVLGSQERRSSLLKASKQAWMSKSQQAASSDLITAPSNR